MTDFIKELTLTKEQFDWALTESRIKEKGQNFLYRVIVGGESIPEVANDLSLSKSLPYSLMDEFRANLRNKMKKTGTQPKIVFEPIDQRIG